MSRAHCVATVPTTSSAGRRCDKSLESLTAFYAKVDPAKEKAAIERIYTKFVAIHLQNICQPNAILTSICTFGMAPYSLCNRFKLSNRLDDLWAKIGKKCVVHATLFCTWTNQTTCRVYIR